MKQKYDRGEDILRFVQPHMEERFLESCSKIQKKLENSGMEMWGEMRECIRQILERTADMQEQKKKGKTAYLICSFLQCSVYLNRLLLRMETLDEGFYLDEQEASGYYCPGMLQEVYQEDLIFLHRKVSERFIRVQNHELDEVNRIYTEYYDALMCRIVESMSRLILRTVSESRMKRSDDLQIMYGEYMGSAKILYI